MKIESWKDLKVGVTVRDREGAPCQIVHIYDEDFADLSEVMIDDEDDFAEYLGKPYRAYRKDYTI